MADKKELEELKKLPPAERIKKLKELQERDKQEIQKAQELIKESEEQEAVEKELERVPIPQIKAVNIENLFSSEEKELFKAKRFVSGTQTDEPAEETAEQPEKLETIAETAPRLSQEQQQSHSQYINQLSQAPAEDLKNRATEIYNSVKESGYMDQKQQEELNNIDYATKKKMDEIEAGKYSSATKEIASAMVGTEKIKNWLQDKYQR